ncbi:MAG TPA: 4-hydroxy-tetrahydrodipicolinate reductase [Steroidobacteraceae bacterium]|nr:4-hydroxy-tetrahydrodipicolinate reductase [Steroidobacteraceae bacterium]HRX88849.1 4-hydroxy-tetrahydrodipicolinate reductase [Steroidobacteraceae bacterium]
MASAGVKVAIIGAAGRMGRSIIANARDDTSVEIVAAVVSANSEALGRDAGEIAGGVPIGVPCRADLAAALRHASVAIDVTRADQVEANARACVAAQVPLVICTTGLSAASQVQLEEHSNRGALLIAANTSIGVAVLRALVRRAAELLPEDFDIEIVEAHHKHKRDAPSGTAIALGQAAAAGRGVRFDDVCVTDRTSRGDRVSGEIGLASLRAGDLVGRHTVWLAGQGELVTIGHEATDRSVFARGALRAAAWLAGKGSGRYGMDDVIGL